MILDERLLMKVLCFPQRLTSCIVQETFPPSSRIPISNFVWKALIFWKAVTHLCSEMVAIEIFSQPALIAQAAQRFALETLWGFVWVSVLVCFACFCTPSVPIHQPWWSVPRDPLRVWECSAPLMRHQLSSLSGSSYLDHWGTLSLWHIPGQQYIVKSNVGANGFCIW